MKFVLSAVLLLASAVPRFEPDAIATDSKGNIYLGESFGRRVLKWSFKGTS